VKKSEKIEWLEKRVKDAEDGEHWWRNNWQDEQSRAHKLDLRIAELTRENDRLKDHIEEMAGRLDAVLNVANPDISFALLGWVKGDHSDAELEAFKKAGEYARQIQQQVDAALQARLKLEKLDAPDVTEDTNHDDE
jgi:hypothetical protein